MSTSIFKKFIAVFAVIVFLLLAAVSAVVAYIDPFFRYHAPREGFPYVIDSQLSQNIGMAERFSYDSVITGSSMTMNFDTLHFTELMQLQPLKLTVNGAYPEDIRRMLDAADRGDQPLREAFIALDAATWTAPRGEVKYPYPSYLYDRNPFNDVKYLWNLDVLLEYCLRPLAEREATQLNRIYMTEWEDDLYYTLAWILDHYAESPKEPAETPADAFLADTERNLEEVLLPFIDAHPETRFTFFYAPYSILFWHNVVQENHLEATLSQEQLIAETLLTRPNVRIFQFQEQKEIITNMDGGYMDEIHFRPEINRYMVECFASDTCRMHDAGEMQASLDRLREMIGSYDYASLLMRK